MDAGTKASRVTSSATVSFESLQMAF